MGPQGRGRQAGTDAYKIAEEFAGTRKPSCSSRYGQGFQTLCRENPPAGVPIPCRPRERAGGDVAAGRRVHRLPLRTSRAPNGSPRRQPGSGKPCTSSSAHPYTEANDHEMGLRRGRSGRRWGWGTYGQGSDPDQDGKDAAAICAAACRCAAGRQTVKHGRKARTRGRQSRSSKDGRRRGAVPVGLVGAELGHRELRPQLRLQRALYRSSGADIDLQVYGATYPTFTVAAGLGMLTKAVPPVGRLAGQQ